MQGECAVIVQVWPETPETPPDVPLNICCYSLELGPCFQSDIDEDRAAWPLLQHIAEQCSGWEAEVEWNKDTQSTAVNERRNALREACLV